MNSIAEASAYIDLLEKVSAYTDRQCSDHYHEIQNHLKEHFIELWKEQAGYIKCIDRLIWLAHKYLHALPISITNENNVISVTIPAEVAKDGWILLDIVPFTALLIQVRLNQDINEKTFWISYKSVEGKNISVVVDTDMFGTMPESKIDDAFVSRLREFLAFDASKENVRSYSEAYAVALNDLHEMHKEVCVLEGVVKCLVGLIQGQLLELESDLFSIIPDAERTLYKAKGLV